MKLDELFKSPYMDAPDDAGGEPDESLDTNEVDEGQEADVELQDGDKGTGEVDSQTNEKPRQDRDTNEQFKAARLAAEKEKQRIIAEREQDAKDAGFESYADMQAYIKQKKVEAERQYYESQGINPDVVNQLIENHPAVQQAHEITVKSRIATEKAALSVKPFFKELEQDIDRILAVNPNLNVELVYNHVRGERLEELLDKASKNSEKRAIANIYDRKSRGLPASSDGGADDDVELSDEGKEMAMAFGNDPKKIAKHVKKQIRS